MSTSLIGKIFITEDNIAFTLVKGGETAHVINIVDLNTMQVIDNKIGQVSCRLINTPLRRKYFKVIAQKAGLKITHYRGADRIDSGTILSFRNGRYLSTLIADTPSKPLYPSLSLVNSLDTHTGQLVTLSDIFADNEPYALATESQVEQYYNLLHILLHP